ncbi:MAG: glutamine-hydrolyzing carbamoyl-phosphate synthase small subunit [marine benthic group bacterium]|nr:glutamine-hydrolyzing carbamoyl-phosphate synthase small subunit [Candidatus Benthicola marisminoris]
MTLTQDLDGYLLVEDGRSWTGKLAGARMEAAGEVVFTTNLTGYQEVLTDPSFAGQIVVMTAPMIGNYGVNPGDEQAGKPWVSGFVVRELSRMTTGWRARGSLEDYLVRHQIVVLDGADTRAITRHVREWGAMRSMIVPSAVPEEDALQRLLESPGMEGLDLASTVSTVKAYEVPAHGPEKGTVVCLDYGVKRRSLELIAAEGYRVTVLPSTADLANILQRSPDGVFVSNGPGDPAAVPAAADVIRAVSDAGIPVFGICLGCQLIARAFGGRTFKLPYGHRGGNHPVRNLETGAVEITSQNHGFAIEANGSSAAGADDLRVTHLNLNDGTVEGLSHAARPVFAVQYHPEAAPGPHDSRYLFRRFVDAMDATSFVPTG